MFFGLDHHDKSIACHEYPIQLWQFVSYNGIIHSINGVLLVLITGITRAVTVLCLHFAHRRTIFFSGTPWNSERRAAYEKVQHHQDGNRIAKVLKFKSHRGLGRVDLPLLKKEM